MTSTILPFARNNLTERLLESSRFNAALDYHTHLLKHHWSGSSLRGPDPGVRFNYRIGRFLKSYVPLHWKDDLEYLQAQAYWILANWKLFDHTKDEKFHQIAIQCSTFAVQKQRSDGAWEYPNKEWQGRIATSEGGWSAIALIESYSRTSHPEFLNAVRRWIDFLVNRTGFQRSNDQVAVNYFSARPGPRVANNSALVLRMFAEFAKAAGEPLHNSCDGMVKFLRSVQNNVSGEIPYAVNGDAAFRLLHFQCYQYNAFQALDLFRYSVLTGNMLAFQVAREALRFVANGICQDGHLQYDCRSNSRYVLYHTAVAAAAFLQATRLGCEEFAPFAQKSYEYILNQPPTKKFTYSHNDYGCFSDRRSYPRYIAMQLFHLLA